MAERLYERALKDYQQGNYEAAVVNFKQFLRQAPKASQAGQAQYLIGEALYALKEYEAAIVAFDEVGQKYPQDTHAPAALLKEGLAFAELKDLRNARWFLQQVQRKYPASVEAQQAAGKLRSLGASPAPEGATSGAAAGGAAGTSPGGTSGGAGPALGGATGSPGFAPLPPGWGGSPHGGRGERIIFAARHYQLKGASHFQMWQAHPDGTGQRRLRWPAGVPLFALPSPDGQQYVYAGVWIAALPVYFQEERTRDFLNGADPQDPALWIVRADGRARRQLLERAPVDLRWLASGQQLLLPEPPHLLDVKTGQRKATHDQPESFTYHFSSLPWFKAPSGTVLFRPPIEYVVAEKDGSYWRVHLPTKTIVQLPLPRSTSPDVGTSWSTDTPSLSSPDGRKLANTEVEGLGLGLGVIDLLEGTIKSFLEGEEGPINHFEWSPQGNQLLVERYGGLAGGPHSQLFIVNLETGRYHLIDWVASDTAQWAPSGQWVVYQTAVETRPLGKKRVWSSDIGAVRADGTGKTYLTSGAVYACMPRWITVTKSQ